MYTHTIIKEVLLNMNKVLKRIQIISSVIAIAALALILLAINTTIFSDKVIMISMVVLLLSGVICLLSIVFVLIQLLVQKKLQKFLKQNWKTVLIDWAVTCLILGVCLIIKDGFSYTVLWCIPISMVIELLQDINHNL